MEGRKKITLRLRHYLKGHLQQDGGGGMCLGFTQIPSLQQRTTTAVKQKHMTHKGRQKGERGTRLG